MDTSSSNPEPRRPLKGTPRSSSGTGRVRLRRKVGRGGLPTNHFLMFWRREKYFRWAIFGSVIFGTLFVSLALSHWTTSPAGVNPVIRVRLMRIVSSWNLEHSARQAVEAGRNDLAIRAWEESIGQNPGNVRAIRGLLRTVQEIPQVSRQTLSTAIAEGGRLLALTATNSQDLDLVANFYGKFDVYDMALWHLNGSNVPVTPAISFALVKALYETGQAARLQEVLKQRAGSLTNHPEAELYRMATYAAWGSDRERIEYRDKLKASVSTFPPDSALHLTALRLVLRTAFFRLDRIEYERSLAHLTDLHADELTDHLRYFLLLEASGLRDEALRLAKENIALPKNAQEAELQISVWTRLGMSNEAANFAQTQLVRLGYPTRLCVSLIPFLYNSHLADELRPLAVALRQTPQVSGIYGGYSYFLEGLAELGIANRKGAEVLFDRYAKDPPQDPNLILSSAGLLSRNGFGFQAAKLLKTIEPVRGETAEFWRQMQAAAFTSHDANLLYSACERLYHMTPSDPVVANNYAASLLILREQSAEAVRITLEVKTALPDSFSAVVNHAVALCQLGRPDEALALIKDSDPNQYGAEDRSTLIFALFQCHAALGNAAEARRVAKQLDRSFLFPPQIDWLNKTLRELPR